MSILSIKDYVCKELTLIEQQIASDFISYLEDKNLTFYKDNCDCWKDKIYYWVKLGEKCVCFIPASNEPSAVPYLHEHLANAARVKYPAACCASSLIPRQLAAGSLIAIKDPDEPENHWTVWSADISSEWLEKYPVDEKTKERAYKHVDHCGHCGSCGGGRHKVIFGKEFNDVCGCTFRVDNPTFADLTFLKTMVEIRIKEIYN